MNSNFTRLKKTVNLFLLLIIPLLAKSQDHWTDLLQTSDPTFIEMQQAFNNYWDPYDVVGGKYIENGVLKKAYGWKQFKRWEWFAGSRLLPNGEFPENNITMQEWNNYFNSQQNSSSFQGSSSSSSSSSYWTYAGSNSSGGGYAGIGRLNCIAFHPSLSNTFWVGSPAGGLWKTTDGGTTWTTNTDNSLPVLGVSSMVIDYNNPDIMYIATGDGESNWNSSTHSAGVLKTIDGGATWNTTGLNWSTSQELIIRRLLMDPNNSQILFAASKDGIWRTTDGGSTWTKRVSGFFRDLEFKPGNSNYMYASTHEGSGSGAKIYRSTNNGLTWTQVHSFSSSTVVQCELSVTADNPSLVEFIAVNPTRGMEGLYRSTNSGATYTKYLNAQGSTNTNFLSSEYDASGNKGQGTYDLTYLINPNDEDNIWIGGVNTWESTDGGTTWTLNNFWTSYSVYNPNSVQVVHADKHFHAYNGNKLYECNDGGLYVSSDNGVSWTDISNGLGIGQIYRIGTSATTSNNVICGLQDNGSKELTNGGWDDVTGGDGMECIIDYTNSGIEYGTYVLGEIKKTTNGWGSSTVIVGNNGTGVDEEGAWVTPYVMHPNNHNTLIVGKSQIYQTTDGGSNWTQLGDISSLIWYDVIALAYAPSDPQTIYFSEDNDNEVFKTSNGGSSWSQIPTSPGSEEISYITVDPNNPNRLWVTKSGYASNDKVWYYDGTSWTNISGTLPNVSANCIVYETGTNDGLYVGTDLGVFHRDASMSGWNAFMTGLPNVVIGELEISYLDGKIWAGTYGRGLWESPLYNSLGLAGCMDSTAINYNPLATIDDSSCIICSGTWVTLNMTDSYGDGWNGNTWTATGALGSSHSYTLATGSAGSESFCMDNDCYTLACGGGQWMGEVGWTLVDINGTILASGGAPYNSTTCIWQGCTDMTACNYDPLATMDDGSCVLPDGCTDATACNYDAAAICDDGSCEWTSCAGVCANAAPTGLNATNVLQNRATINWDNMNDANCMVDQYRIKYRDITSSGAWTQKNMGQPLNSCLWGANNTDKLILNLTPSTTYQYQMKAWYCDGSGMGVGSSWSAMETFTTEDDCPNVGNLAVSTPSTTKATFTWDDSNGAYSFVRIKMRADTLGGVTWFNVGGMGVNYGIFTKNKNGLNPGASYRAQARTWCDPNGGAWKSPTWTSLVYWTMPTVIRLEGGSAIANLAIYPNPSRDIFNVSFTSEDVQDLKVRVINVIGEELILDNLEQFIGEYTKQINLSNNAKGIYFLEITTNNGMVNKKLILQ